MFLYDVISGRTVKNASLRNLRRWTYNDLGFCIVDESGKFWRWHFNDKLPPALVFRLVDRAPRDSLRCLTTRDGSWNAIVATSRDRKRGEVHCYPTDNDEARIFPGILAAFMQAEVDGVTVTYVVVVNVESDTEVSFAAHIRETRLISRRSSCHSLSTSSVHRVRAQCGVSRQGCHLKSLVGQHPPCSSIIPLVLPWCSSPHQPKHTLP